jgi:hypothetical protein
MENCRYARPLFGAPVGGKGCCCAVLSASRIIDMSALMNTRHEAYAQALATGMSADAAYSSVGYTPNRKNASRLKTNEGVSARVVEIMGLTAAVITDLQTAARLHSIAALNALVRIVTDVTAPAAAQIAAAKELLDRAYGKAPATIDQTMTVIDEMDQSERLEALRVLRSMRDAGAFRQGLTLPPKNVSQG